MCDLLLKDYGDHRIQVAGNMDSNGRSFLPAWWAREGTAARGLAAKLSPAVLGFIPLRRTAAGKRDYYSLRQHGSPEGVADSEGIPGA